MARFKLPKSKCERILEPKGSFAPRSFRWIKSGRGRLLIGCPLGKWSATGTKTIKGRKVTGVCKVGTKVHIKVTPKEGRTRCPPGQKRRGTY